MTGPLTHAVQGFLLMEAWGIMRRVDSENGQASCRIENTDILSNKLPNTSKPKKYHRCPDHFAIANI